MILLSIAPIVGGQIKFQSFPNLESDTIEARLTLPQGTPQWLTEERVAQVVKALQTLNDELTPEQPDGATLVKNYTVFYGSNADTDETGAQLATVSASLMRAKARSANVTQIVERWKKLTGPMPDMSGLRFTDKDRGVGGKPISIRLQGEDLDELKATAVEMRKFFRGFNGVRDVLDDLRPGKPEYIITLRPAAASALGVSAQSIAGQLRRAFRGDTPLQVQDRYGSLDVIARLQPDDRDSAADVQHLRIAAADDRLRAIFLTSLTTVAGLEPLLFETSTQAQLLLPIVASLAFGLTIATMLSLFVTPAMFLVLHDMGLIRRAKPGETEE